MRNTPAYSITRVSATCITAINHCIPQISVQIVVFFPPSASFSKHGRAIQAVPQPEPEAASPLKCTRKLSIATGATAAHTIPLLHPFTKFCFSFRRKLLSSSPDNTQKAEAQNLFQAGFSKVQPELDLLLQGPLYLRLRTTQENGEKNYSSVIALQ